MQLGPKPKESHSAPDASEERAAAVQGVTRPGEFIHYYTNLLSLFGNERPAAEIREHAHAASELRVRAIDGFADRLNSLNSDFLQQRAASGKRPERMPAPLMQGWDEARVQSIVKEHGGVLIALFHFGEHRQIFADLASLGVPFVAPVAKHAYFDFCEILKHGPKPFEDAMSLLEVEDPRVGRKLFSALRKGRAGLIYVDGNMGPDGHLVEDGGVRVEFLGKRIRAKAGIARLSIGLGLPVLPVFASTRDGSVHAEIRSLITPPAKSDLFDDAQTDAALTSIMQTLYTHLASEVRRAPEHWEFAFCFHRWLDESESAALTHDDGPLPAESHPLKVDAQRITEFRRDGEVFWIHVGRQRAYRLPQWAHGLHACLDSDRTTLGRSLSFLQQSGGAPEQARELMRELMRLGLLEPLQVAA
jgi:lauroyl/myristoyl acyltransferase